MEPAQKERIVGETLALARDAKPSGAADLVREFAGFGFNGASDERFVTLVAWLLKDQRWSAKYSERYLKVQLADLIGLLRREGKPALASGHVDAFVGAFDAFNDKQIVYVPLINIEMAVRRVRIGNVQLRRITRAFVREFRGRLEKAVEETSQDEETKREFVARQLKSLEVRGPVVAEAEVVAEPRRAGEIATAATRSVVDYLNFAGSVIWPPRQRHVVAIRGDALREATSLFVVRGDFGQFSAQHRATQPHLYRLDSATKKELVRLRLRKVSKMLARDDGGLNDLEQAIIQGLHWFGDSLVQTSLENELLSLTTCIETFHTVAGQRIATPLAEGMAITLTRGLENRKKLRDRMKQLYGLRGHVTHGRDQSILEEDVIELRWLAANLLIVLIDNRLEFSSREDLRDWIEDERLS